MANHTFVQLDIPGTQLLGEIAGIRDDLEAAERFASRLVQTFSEHSGERDLDELLTTAILVRYTRVFSPGRTKIVRSQLDQLSDDQQDRHEYFFYWRSKHIAHSVNSFERNIVTARFVSETVHEEGIQSIAVEGNRIVGFSSQDLQAIRELIGVFKKFVDREYEQEQRRVLAIVREIPVQEILAGPKKPYSPGNESVKSSRPREPR